MRKIITLFIIMFSFFTKGNAQYNQLATDFSFKSVEGNIINLGDYKEKVILVVNVASRCGFTNQYKGLQSLWNEYKDQGLVVIGVPSNDFRQEPGTNKEIKNFCETTFGIDFLISEKINVTGDNAHSFFLWAKKNYGSSAIPKWNFHKIIIGKNGKIAETFSSITKPSSKKFIAVIEKEIKN
jgi:glutathione peroxidase